MFGRPLKEDGACYWGARAIYNPRYRGGMLLEVGWAQYIPTPPEVVFVSWLQSYALPELKKRLRARMLSTRAQDVLVIEDEDDGRFYLEASPQGSGGYIYIGAIDRGTFKKAG